MSESSPASPTLPLIKWLSTTKELSQIFAMVALPILLAMYGYWTHDLLQDKQINQKYVEMAIAVLSNEGADVPMRNWARQVLDAKSPVPMPNISADDARFLLEDIRRRSLTDDQLKHVVHDANLAESDRTMEPPPRGENYRRRDGK
jgi:hypothetical protein